ncbi:uncharacterized protein BKCO1_6400030 [Diplodia corticola]|uniref:Uncharacterized protein n=1 Tax=Diplodia corticola TaxID=236234 RepID=A0A1J9QP40_9PEZI|nr:uncharacterized protein BKCO1_6400030 [Diplodia corticola]OJD30216.1 hypothetical protein BKCO1_6400030 [Diplodia corticola]
MSSAPAPVVQKPLVARQVIALNPPPAKHYFRDQESATTPSSPPDRSNAPSPNASPTPDARPPPIRLLPPYQRQPCTFQPSYGIAYTLSREPQPLHIPENVAEHATTGTTVGEVGPVACARPAVGELDEDEEDEEE